MIFFGPLVVALLPVVVVSFVRGGDGERARFGQDLDAWKDLGNHVAVNGPAWRIDESGDARLDRDDVFLLARGGVFHYEPGYRLVPGQSYFLHVRSSDGFRRLPVPLVVPEHVSRNDCEYLLRVVAMPDGRFGFSWYVNTFDGSPFRLGTNKEGVDGDPQTAVASGFKATNLQL
jgi:hypothetical protein